MYWRLVSCRMWCHSVWKKSSDTSQEPAASIISVELHFTQTTWYDITEDSNLSSHHCENLKCQLRHWMKAEYRIQKCWECACCNYKMYMKLKSKQNYNLMQRTQTFLIISSITVSVLSTQYICICQSGSSYCICVIYKWTTEILCCTLIQTRFCVVL